MIDVVRLSCKNKPLDFSSRRRLFFITLHPFYCLYLQDNYILMFLYHNLSLLHKVQTNTSLHFCISLSRRDLRSRCSIYITISFQSICVTVTHYHHYSKHFRRQKQSTTIINGYFVSMGRSTKYL